uniref:Uncharacterized protein n=1 Tax=Mesocestoides corti TaxID=53468 RepID=A0A5K3F361_MESCO
MALVQCVVSRSPRCASPRLPPFGAACTPIPLHFFDLHICGSRSWQCDSKAISTEAFALPVGAERKALNDWHDTGIFFRSHSTPYLHQSNAADQATPSTPLHAILLHCMNDTPLPAQRSPGGPHCSALDVDETVVSPYHSGS